jgi:hypothetical protein
MERNITGYIPRILFRIYLTLKDKFDPRPPIAAEEQFSIDICSKLISKKDTELHYAPKSNKRFIRNDELDIFIVITIRTIQITNHDYSHSVYIENNHLYSELLENFDSEIEQRKEELETEIANNIQHSLKNILQKVNQ